MNSELSQLFNSLAIYLILYYSVFSHIIRIYISPFITSLRCTTTSSISSSVKNSTNSFDILAPLIITWPTTPGIEREMCNRGGSTSFNSSSLMWSESVTWNFSWFSWDDSIKFQDLISFLLLILLLFQLWLFN